MKILITGANGQVGRELVRYAAQFQHTTIATVHRELNITQLDEIETALQKHTPDILINAAAYTAVDRAEQDEKLAYQVNAEACKYLAQACKKANVPLLHISTDYVFDGSSKTAYLETDPVCPLGIYGASKARGEAHIQNIWEKHIILRTAWVFSQHGNNFVKTMLRLGKERKELSVVADQKGGPTAASDIAKALLQIASTTAHKSAWGIYHYCGNPVTTWHGFAQHVFEYALDETTLSLETLHAIGTAQYPTPAERPLNSSMNCEKIKHAFGLAQPNWHDSLRAIIQEMHS